MPHDPSSSDRKHAIALLEASRFGALGVVMQDGAPYVAMAAYTVEPDTADVLLFLSRLSDHRRALERDPRASLMVETPDLADEEKLANPRVSLLGAVEPVASHEELRQQWVARHPESRQWIAFPDFGFFRFRTRKARLIEGFGTAKRVRF